MPERVVQLLRITGLRLLHGVVRLRGKQPATGRLRHLHGTERLGRTQQVRGRLRRLPVAEWLLRPLDTAHSAGRLEE